MVALRVGDWNAVAHELRMSREFGTRVVRLDPHMARAITRWTAGRGTESLLFPFKECAVWPRLVARTLKGCEVQRKLNISDWRAAVMRYAWGCDDAIVVPQTRAAWEQLQHYEQSVDCACQRFADVPLPGLTDSL